MNAKQYAKWLESKGLSSNQIKQKKQQLGNPVQFPDYTVTSKHKLANTIPANGTKSPDQSKAQFTKNNYATVPAYNKGPIMLVTIEQLRQGAGRKI